MLDHRPRHGSLEEHRLRVHSIYLNGSLVQNVAAFHLDEGWLEHTEDGHLVRKTVAERGPMSVLYHDGTVAGAPLPSGALPLSFRLAQHRAAK